MNCPVCNEPMVVIEHRSIEIDYCLACGGIWLDADEIELLYQDAEACRAVLSIGSPTDRINEKKRRCPICKRRMCKEQTTGLASKIIFDRCPNGDGLWFDNGELISLLEQRELVNPQVEETLRFLREIFKPE